MKGFCDSSLCSANKTLVFVGIAWLLMASCSLSADQNTNAEPLNNPSGCVPGRQVSCSCNAAKGSQTCLGDGTYAPCECAPVEPSVSPTAEPSPVEEPALEPSQEPEPSPDEPQPEPDEPQPDEPQPDEPQPDEPEVMEPVPSPMPMPQQREALFCDDREDNDLDGAVDCEDTDCQATAFCAQNTCAGKTDFLPPGQFRIRGSTSGANSFYQPSSCVGPNALGDAGDIVIAWTPTAEGCYAFDLRGSNFDTVLSLHEDCNIAEQFLICNDDTPQAGNNLTSYVEFSVNANTPYFIVIDGYGEEEGEWQMQIEPGCPDSR